MKCFDCSDGAVPCHMNCGPAVPEDNWLETLQNWERRDAAKRGWEKRKKKEAA